MIDEIAENPIAEGVMGNLAQAPVLIGRHANDMKNERTLGLRPHDPVQRRQFSNPYVVATVPTPRIRA